MTETADVVVVGGGIIGCASAYSLAKEGLHVILLERDHIGAHASGGSAGILSSRDDDPGAPMDLLNRASLALHPCYARDLLEETRIDVEYQQAGSLTLLRQEEMPVQPRFDARLLDRAELLELEPPIGKGWAGAILHVDDGQVNTGRLTEALAQGAARYGAAVRRGGLVTGFLQGGGRVRGVQTVDGDIEAGHVVAAAGPWSALLGQHLGLTIPVFPIKGEIYWAHDVPHLLNRPVFAGCYLVPKPQQGLAIGATYLRAGFDETPTVGGALELLSVALQAVPSLASAALSRAWASLRPGTPDGLPILGPVPGLPGLILATGHSAYGIALSLITGELVKNWVLNRAQPVPVEPFSLERFSS